MWCCCAAWPGKAARLAAASPQAQPLSQPHLLPAAGATTAKQQNWQPATCSALACI
jgi:hypothetical protein